jgi:hypothetical protein
MGGTSTRSGWHITVCSDDKQILHGTAANQQDAEAIDRRR